ncbi:MULTISPECIES: hypothetical protein [Microbacterium]|uniref:Uncharacterized protein n=1 Tax=Microbacterium saccharophilum TaxID=1213358 RepID=A0A7Z7D220_9MICO|nr:MULTISPECIES: hypothetical protein [Microbacterium]SFI58962.1 hypothetical protein SAMN04487751_2273 [Microbacterium saccharophilum]
MGSAWIYLVAVPVVLVVAGVVFVFARAALRARRADEVSPVITVTLVVAALWAGFSVVAAIVTLALTLGSPEVAIAFPVREFWPQLPDGTTIDGPTATLVSGGFTSVGGMVADLSLGVRVCWGIGQALSWLVPGAIAGLLAVACFQLLAGRAFAPVVARMAMVTAVVVMVGGVAAQVLGDIAGSMAAAEVLQWSGAGYEEVAGIEDVLDAWWPKPAVGITFPFWPIAAGLGFAALATILRHGARLERDTAGLV